MLAVGEIIGGSDEVIKNSRLSMLVAKQSSYVTPFVDNIRMIGKLHDKPLQLLFDNENVFIKTSN